MNFTALVSVAVVLTAVSARAAVQGEAFREGMHAARWSSANKQFVGTAFEAYDSKHGYSSQSATAPISKVWFTGGRGILNEIMWPSVDTPQVKDSQFVVSDGASFVCQERTDASSHVEWLAAGVPAFRVTNTDPLGRFTIEKTIFTDPDRDVVLTHVRIDRHVSGLNIYYLHKPGVSNTPLGNSALVSNTGLYAWQGSQAQAVLFSVPLRAVSAGFEGASDGWTDLTAHFQMNYRFETATNGNVAEMAWLDLGGAAGVSEFDVAIGFGSDVGVAEAAARTSLSIGYEPVLSEYARQWTEYQRTLVDLSSESGDGGALFRSSIAVLKSSEDKTSAGAIVASPTVPWGNHHDDNNSEVYRNGSRAHQTGGYHMVWPRDLYQMATTFMAVGDPASAVASLNFLRAAQYGPDSGTWKFGFRTHSKDGSFPQNCWTNGEVYWAGLQMDEVAMPVVLAYRLWHAGEINVHDYWDMVRRASDLIATFGPWSPQERWEEAPGASPSTIAAEIAALWTAGEIAQAVGDTARARHYRETADSWSAKPGDNVEAWTFTSTGQWGNGHYYTRIQGSSAVDEAWNPNGETKINLANGAGQWREKDLTDGGFLELVRFGVRPALDGAIIASLPVLDATIGVDLPGIGPGWKRYLHDRYNYADDSGEQTDGMIWPFFTGERGHYELERALEEGRGAQGASDAALPFVVAMEKMATPTHMLPEQVWDSGPAVGQATGSATPLGWTHGEYIKLLRSRRDGAVYDRLRVVEERTQLNNRASSSKSF